MVPRTQSAGPMVTMVTGFVSLVPDGNELRISDEAIRYASEVFSETDPVS